MANPVREWPRWLRIAIVAGLALAACIALLLFPRIPQSPEYHVFADTRSDLGIPNALNVLSNLAFLFAAIAGFRAVAQAQFAAERVAYLVFFAGVALTSIGSGYYHLDPNNRTLVWDRLPMGISFMAIVNSVIAERIGPRVAGVLLLPMLAFGAGSVWYWHVTELKGLGDLRPYVFVQFGGALVIPAILWLFPARYSGTQYLGLAAIAYGAAKLFELCDRQIYAVGQVISGHTLKHLSAALAAWFVARMLAKRKLIANSEEHQAARKQGMALVALG